MPIKLKRPDGSVTPYKNAEYIPAYLFLPAAILDRCPQELQLPRTVASYFHDWNVISTVESDLFIELIMDGFAHLVWPYLGVSGYMENYSGYDPVYIIAHSPAFWVQTLQDEGIIPKVEDLMRYGQGEIMGLLPEAEVSACFEQIFPLAMDRYRLFDVIEAVKEMRCPEDYDFRRSHARTDFIRKWYHTRTKHAEFSLDAWNEKRWRQYETQGIDIPDTCQDMEGAAITQADAERFLAELPEKDRQILQLRLEGYTLEEIAERLGYKNHSGVLKRIRKIGEAYQQYANVDLGFDEPNGA